MTASAVVFLLIIVAYIIYIYTSVIETLPVNQQKQYENFSGNKLHVIHLFYNIILFNIRAMCLSSHVQIISIGEHRRSGSG